jgi:hypothetical protein
MNKKQLISAVVMISFVLCLGCIRGGTLKENIIPSYTPNVRYVPCNNIVKIPCLRKVAIFPFADYSHQQDFLGVTEWGGNIQIVEEITDHLVNHGISVAVQEDVNTLLADYNVIRPIDKEKYLLFGTVEETDDSYKQVGTPEYELTNYEHSPAMAEDLAQLINRQKKTQPGESASPILQGVTVGLSRDVITELGQILGVDMIIRGRIIEYGYKDVRTLNPFYRGFVPVIFDSMQDVMFGATNGYGYENGLDPLENIVLGSGLGYGIGKQIGDGYGAQGAGVGAAYGWLSTRHPKMAKRSAVVQVRLYAQDARTGDVLWSNRAEIEYTPCSNYAFSSTHPKVMFDKAVKYGVNILMGNFFNDASRVMSTAKKCGAKEGNIAAKK